MSTEGTAAVEKEIAQEKADSLTLAARRLEAALGELRDFDAAAKLDSAGDSAHNSASDPAGKIRKRLVAQAAYRVQNLIIQRESLGLRDATYVFKFYSVPREIIAQIGARPP